jgi:hypothetical protein
MASDVLCFDEKVAPRLVGNFDMLERTYLSNPSKFAKVVEWLDEHTFLSPSRAN